MSIYIDELQPYPRSQNWPYDEVAHLMADDVNELHAFAAKIGLKGEWFQNRKTGKHYDLTKGKWWQAKALGAVLLQLPQDKEKWLELTRKK
jgi:Protein of unknown function (DUF4031)